MLGRVDPPASLAEAEALEHEPLKRLLALDREPPVQDESSTSCCDAPAISGTRRSFSCWKTVRTSAVFIPGSKSSSSAS